jgi:V/A-type H+-transporting ATPase subunit E
MSLQRLVEHIRALGEEEISSLQAEKEGQAKEILSQARADAELIREQRLSKVTLKAQKERAQALNQAQIKALRIEDQARQQLIDEILIQARQSLSKLRQADAYPKILTALVRESLNELGASVEEGEGILLRADKRDQEFIAQALIELDAPVEPHYDLEVWGGVIATTDDGRILVDNTLATRFQRLRPLVKQSLSRKFAG